MKRRLLTDIELRSQWSVNRSKCYYVHEDVILTPAAKDFLNEHGITLCRTEQDAEKNMPTEPITHRNGKPVYVDAQTGKELDHKDEAMTHLRGNRLVSKIHPQIELRGRLDSLEAEIMSVQITAREQNQPGVAEDLEQLLEFTRRILAAEVKDTPLGPVSMLGMDSERIRHDSHHVKEVFGIDHPVPASRMGRLCVELNRLRTQVRETELSAARAFWRDGEFSRSDLIEGLNRMSSCVYIILCRKLSGYYDRENRV